jgi:murein DD-endopeptidase MepM/ murein hydrolase activator NlpD
LGVNGDALWEIQWHPADGGRFRRLVLTRRGLRRTFWALAAVLLVVLVIMAALPLGLRGVLTSFTVDAARRENRALRLRAEELRERAYGLADRMRETVQRGRRVAWELGASPQVWEASCPAPPPRGAEDETTIRWLGEQGVRLGALSEALAAPHDALRCPLAALPVASPVDVRRAVPVALFGWRVSPFTGKTMAQYGVTLAAPQGEPVAAPGAGRVLFAGSVRERKANEWTRFGNLVVLDHGGGVATIYAHLRDVLVKRGQAVARGQRLGSVGQTGWTRVPALYYEVRWPLDERARPVDPGLVTPAVPVEDLDTRLADPSGGLPGGYALLEHLVGGRGERAPRARTPAPVQPRPAAAPPSGNPE